MPPRIKPGHSFILVDQTGRIAWRWDWTEEKGEMYLAVETLNSGVARALGEPDS
jgi:hypothetical protein